MNSHSTQFVAIHGSALTSRNPADVDVVYCGVNRDWASAIAQEWAQTHGFEHLELDLMESTYVPFPPGKELVYEVIHGQKSVGTQVINNLPALLRGGGDDEEWASRINGANWLKVGLEANGNQAFRERIQGYDGDGPLALRTALRKVSYARLELLGGLGRFLYGVKAIGVGWEDPKLGPSVMDRNVLAMMRPFSPVAGNGAALIFFRKRGDWVCRPEYAKPAMEKLDWWKFLTS